MKHILVTGGAGFIGSHVVDELLLVGFKVRILDNLGPPTHNGALPEWVNKKAEFVQGDVRSKEDWRKALRGINGVVHLASYMDYHLDFSTYIRTNIESVALLFELIVEEKLPIQKIVAASSQSVYGQGKYQCETHGIVYPPMRSEVQLAARQWEVTCPECHKPIVALPETESDEPSPQIPYGISKLASEKFLFNLGRQYGVPSVALRYSIVLGPRQSFRHFYSGALRSFAVDVLNNQSIQMNEDGGQTHDFVHVRDIAHAHLTVLTDHRADFECFNVGIGKSIRVIDLAKMVAEESGVPFNPSFNNRYRVGNIRYTPMNIDKLRGLGWEPKYTVRDAVKDYLQWVRQFNGLKEALEKTYNEMARDGILKTGK
ncbi:MAG: NAD-dependent epimerase/dehydratase family protein [Candidatus Magasanikbacteria bacterium]|nr:NAD-dependent epimerase/dehydratase family protein [Candidatus Magasanikbacteria bacterium]